MPVLQVTNARWLHMQNGKHHEIGSHLGQRCCRSGITYEYAIPLEIAFAATALIDSDLELSRELLFYSKLAIEIKANQVNRLWLQECTPSFPEVPRATSENANSAAWIASR